MSGIFQNIDPHPLTAKRVCTSRLWCGGRTHSLGVNILEDARHCSVLYTCKYFVAPHPFESFETQTLMHCTVVLVRRIMDSYIQKCEYESNWEHCLGQTSLP
jgi:hypothetical protein